MKSFDAEVTLQKIVGGGQAMGELNDGRKIFVWGGLPGEKVLARVTKMKSKFAEGIVTQVLQPSTSRVKPRDPASYLSTSPWQIMSTDAEIDHKKELLKQAYELNHIKTPEEIDFYTDTNFYRYRNKVEFSWWWDNDNNRLDLAFFRRGSHTKIPVENTSLARDEINQAAQKIRTLLNSKSIEAFSLKTLMLRCNQAGKVVAQLYVKTKTFAEFTDDEISATGVKGFEVIFSNPKSPASVISEKLFSWGNTILDDTILDRNFHYTADSFFQINLPVYKKALLDMSRFIDKDSPVVDFYSGVGTIGLTIGGANTTLIESNPAAVDEMRRNIASLGTKAKAILSVSEKSLDHIIPDSLVIVDPPRAGLHDAVVDRLLDTQPNRIMYLSCNPVTQGRDVSKLLEKYNIIYQRGYNFFPRTPHIENLFVLQVV